MSNQSLKNKILNSLTLYKDGEISIDELKSAIDKNGRAFENMPYALIKDIEDIEYELTVSIAAAEDDCDASCDEAIILIETWLKKIPV